MACKVDKVANVITIDITDPLDPTKQVRYVGNRMNGDSGTQAAQYLLNLGAGLIISLLLKQAAIFLKEKKSIEDSAGVKAKNLSLLGQEDSEEMFMKGTEANTQARKGVVLTAEEAKEEEPDVMTRVPELMNSSDFLEQLINNLDVELIVQRLLDKVAQNGGLLQLRNFFLSGYMRVELTKGAVTNATGTELTAANMKYALQGKELEWMIAVKEILVGDSFFTQLITFISSLKKK